jgi:CelD/BcsL family acetyltransferase involved in cellulose biosynthesis
MRVDLSDDPTTFRASDWGSVVAADPFGSFFHTPEYLKLYWEEFGSGRLVIATATDDADPVAACVFTVDEGLLTFLGGFDVTDYMGPVAVPGRAEAFAKELFGGALSEFEWERADLRGMKADAPWASLLEDAAAAQGLRVDRLDDGVCPILPLPSAHEEYLAALPAKLRHEIRRKDRRLQADLGAYEIELATEETLPDLYDRFIELHRESPGPKGKFLHAGMEIFFRRLGEAFLPGGVFTLAFIRVGDAWPAGIIGFRFKDTFSLYNSAFDREYAQWSPGMVLISDMIRRSIDEGLATFDLLKGDLEYKKRFGAEASPVARLAVTR